MNQYRVVYVEPGKPAVEKKIGTKLEDLQAEVGGLIECIYCHRDGTLIVANDEAKLLGMEGNRRLDGGSIIAGPFFVIGDAGENFRSLTDAEVNRYLQVYAEPQQISQREVQADIYIYPVDAVCVTAVPKWMVCLADILVKRWVLWNVTV